MLDEAIEDLLRLAAMDLRDYVVFEFDRVQRIKIDDDYKAGARLFFNAFLGSKRRQPIAVDLVMDWIPEEIVEVVCPVDRIEVEGVAVCDYHIVPPSYAMADKYFGVTDLHGGHPSS